jgi:hypothetical protein
MNIKNAAKLLVSELEKAKKMPIGTVSRGRKKVAEGKWVPVKEGRQKSEKSKQKDGEKFKKIDETGLNWLFKHSASQINHLKSKNIPVLRVSLKPNSSVESYTKSQRFGEFYVYENPSFKEDLDKWKKSPITNKEYFRPKKYLDIFGGGDFDENDLKIHSKGSSLEMPK